MHAVHLGSKQLNLALEFLDSLSVLVSSHVVIPARRIVSNTSLAGPFTIAFDLAKSARRTCIDGTAFLGPVERCW